MQAAAAVPQVAHLNAHLPYPLSSSGVGGCSGSWMRGTRSRTVRVGAAKPAGLCSSLVVWGCSPQRGWARVVLLGGRPSPQAGCPRGGRALPLFPYTQVTCLSFLRHCGCTSYFSFVFFSSDSQLFPFKSFSPSLGDCAA